MSALDVCRNRINGHLLADEALNLRLFQKASVGQLEHPLSDSTSSRAVFTPSIYNLLREESVIIIQGKTIYKAKYFNAAFLKRAGL